MATAPEGIKILNKLHTHLNDASKLNKNDADFEIYDINLINDNNNNHIYMSITTILKEYPDIMIKATDITSDEYKNFSEELKTYILTTTTNKSFCDLILFDLICSMRLDILLTTPRYIGPKKIEEITMCNLLKKPVFKSELTEVYTGNSIINFLINDNVIGSLKIINEFIKYFSIPMEKKYKLYKILYVLLNKVYDTSTAALGTAAPGTPEALAKEYTENLLKIFNKLIKSDEIGCAPRTIIHGLQGGYNNKSGDIDYHICKANFKQTFKKVSAKSSREAAKMVAMKVLKDKKKSAKFSLKRMIGKKEKCYDYDVSIDKSGKIIIKNQ